MTPPDQMPIHTLRQLAADPHWANVYEAERERRFELAYYEWRLATGRADNLRNRRKWVNVVSRADQSWTRP
jgi:hypothetical protein